MHFEAAFVKAVGEDFENIAHQTQIVPLVEDVDDVWVAREVLEGVEEQVKTEVAKGAEFVLDAPDDAVHDGVELVLGHVVQLLEVMLDDGLEQRKEVRAVFREAVEVRGYHRQRALEHRTQKSADQVWLQGDAQSLEDSGEQAQELGLLNFRDGLVESRKEVHQRQHEGVNHRRSLGFVDVDALPDISVVQF